MHKCILIDGNDAPNFQACDSTMTVQALLLGLYPMYILLGNDV